MERRTVTTDKDSGITLSQEAMTIVNGLTKLDIAC